VTRDKLFAVLAVVALAALNVYAMVMY